MLQDNIIKHIIKNIGHIPTNDQKAAVEGLAEFLLDMSAFSVFILTGYAGTGKTTLIGSVIKTLTEFNLKSLLLAPTGRAAKVISQYAGKPAYTIHKKIYRQRTSSDGFGVFQLDKNLHKSTLFIVDEASMISNDTFERSQFGSGRLLDDLVEYVYSGEYCKLIVVGDTAQLPPVGLSVSPALEKKALSEYNLDVIQYNLSQVVRQEEGSGILKNATEVRSLIEQEAVKPAFDITSNEVNATTGDQLIEEITSSYDRFGISETMIICRSNKNANRFNEGIRKTILWKEEEISTGDYLMVVKNNYFWMPENEKTDFVANGDIIEVKRINRIEELYGFRFADADICLPDYGDIELTVKLLLDTLTVELPALSMEDNRRLYRAVEEDYAEIGSKRKRLEEIRKNPYFNALQVKFAYAVTCHKAQGGQWKSVFVDQGYITDEMINTDYLRWLYTAITRSTEQLSLVNFHESFFRQSL